MRTNLSNIAWKFRNTFTEVKAQYVNGQVVISGKNILDNNRYVICNVNIENFYED